MQQTIEQYLDIREIFPRRKVVHAKHKTRLIQ
jgi:hypothetical protein